MTFSNYFYSKQFIQQQIKDAELNIDKTENYYTEERRIAYNSTNPEIELDKTITDYPGADPGSLERGSNQDEHIPHKIK